ncbi:ABC-three component system middle component 6 [Cryobacterium sp. N19]|uniref:ABC-three component system middle component 6 n=1 Tax=unclassified Cryobacterium TaxID=2649013 RepID=UPI003512B2B1
MFSRRQVLLLPDKYVHERQSLIGQAGILLANRSIDQTVSELWHTSSKGDDDLTFGRFEAALSFLFILGAVNMNHGILEWGSS